MSTYNLNNENESQLRLLSINKVRLILGISFSKVEELIYTKKLEFVVVGKKKMVPVCKLHKFINTPNEDYFNHTKENLKNIEKEIDNLIKGNHGDNL